MRSTEEVEIVYAPSATGVSPIAPLADRLRHLTKTQSILLALAIGLAIGLTVGLVIGWVIWPVQWTDAGFSDLTVTRQAQVIRLASWVYTFSQNETIVRDTLNFKAAPTTGCEMIALTGDVADRARLTATLGVAGITCERADE